MKLWFELEYDSPATDAPPAVWCFTCAVNQVVDEGALADPKVGQKPPVPKCEKCGEPL